jgi:ATP-dependent DNA helicase RecG
VASEKKAVPRVVAIGAAIEQVADQVSDQVARCLALLKDSPLGVRDAMDVLGPKHRPSFMANYLQPALTIGLVEKTQPDSPNSPTQKYRLANRAHHTGREK